MLEHREWRETRIKVLSALRSGRCWVAVLGPSGTGKTMLLRNLADAVKEPGSTTVLSAAEPGCPPMLVIKSKTRSTAFVDDGHRLSDAAFAALAATTGLQCVFVGPAELGDRLAGHVPAPEILRLGLLSPEDARAYLDMWLERGGFPPKRFKRDAVAELIAVAGGVPRALSEIAGRADWLATEERARRVAVRHVEQAVSFQKTGPSKITLDPDEDEEDEERPPGWLARSVRPVVWGGSLVLAAYVGLFVYRSIPKSPQATGTASAVMEARRPALTAASAPDQIADPAPAAPHSHAAPPIAADALRSGAPTPSPSAIAEQTAPPESGPSSVHPTPTAPPAGKNTLAASNTARPPQATTPAAPVQAASTPRRPTVATPGNAPAPLSPSVAATTTAPASILADRGVLGRPAPSAAARPTTAPHPEPASPTAPGPFNAGGTASPPALANREVPVRPSILAAPQPAIAAQPKPVTPTAPALAVASVAAPVRVIAEAPLPEAAIQKVAPPSDARPPGPVAMPPAMLASVSADPATGTGASAHTVSPHPAAPVTELPVPAIHSLAAPPAAPASSPPPVAMAGTAPPSPPATHGIALPAAAPVVPSATIRPHQDPALVAALVLAAAPATAPVAAATLPPPPLGARYSDPALPPSMAAGVAGARLSESAVPAPALAADRATAPPSVAVAAPVAMPAAVPNPLVPDPSIRPGASIHVASAAPSPSAAMSLSLAPPQVAAAPPLVAAIPSPELARYEAAAAGPPAAAAPGLLLIVHDGETLSSLYSKVYRGVVPPPLEAVAAANPKHVKPGDVLTFPPPPGGWKKQRTASRALP